MVVCTGSGIVSSCSKNEIEENGPSGNGSSNSLIGVENGHEWVDLDLPSGTRWATCNVGASSPEEYGDYFAWGETTGKNSGKTAFKWENYKYSYGSTDLLTKYCSIANCGYEGFTDDMRELQLGDDAARENWGGSWQTPSLAQVQELLGDSTRKVWTTQDGVNGLLIVRESRNNWSKSTGKSIFLPAAGHQVNSGAEDIGNGGYYWTRSLSVGYPGSACSLHIRSGQTNVSTYYYRYIGRSVRPVCK